MVNMSVVIFGIFLSCFVFAAGYFGNACIACVCGVCEGRCRHVLGAAVCDA